MSLNVAVLSLKELQTGYALMYIDVYKGNSN